jgi:predicted DNA-binding protein
MWRVSDLVFKIDKPEPLGATVNSFRISYTVHDRLKAIANRNAMPVHKVILKMIDFALEHMEPADE